MQVFLFFLLLLFFSFSASSFSSEVSSPFSLSDYLHQVVQAHPQYQAWIQKEAAAHLRESEGELLLAPSFFTKTVLSFDGVRNPSVSWGYDQSITRQWSVGVAQMTSFGLSGKVHYDVLSQNYSGLSTAGLPAAYAPLLSTMGAGAAYHNASPVLELRQNFWKNGFGETTKSQLVRQEAETRAGLYAASYQKKVFLSRAEEAYWGLAVVRQSILIQQAARDRAQKIHDWNLKRLSLNLADSSDVLQSETLLKAYDLELLVIQNQEKERARAFNSVRGLHSERVSEVLASLDPNSFQDFPSLPPRKRWTDGVLAEQEKCRMMGALSDLAVQDHKPQLDFFFKAALNGQDQRASYSKVSEAMVNSFSTRHPTYVLGIEFSIPLSSQLITQSDQGWQKEKFSAEKTYQQALFQQEQDWLDSVQKWEESQQQWILLGQLEKLQESKLQLEKQRLQRGRTTTYQVLMFEQDYLKAQLRRLGEQGTLLSLRARMKPYLEEEEGKKP